MLRSCAVALVLTVVSAAPSIVNAQATPTREATGCQDLYMGFSYLVRSYTHTRITPSLAECSAGMQLTHFRMRSAPGLGSSAMHPATIARQVFFSPGIYHILAGPQFSTRAGHSTIFVHGLLGGMLASSDVIAPTRSQAVFAAAAGGGFDHPISPLLDWRLNVDWFYGGFQTNDINQISQIVNNNVRISTGPVLHF